VGHVTWQTEAQRKQHDTHANHLSRLDPCSATLNAESMRYEQRRCWNASSPVVLAPPRMKSENRSCNETKSVSVNGTAAGVVAAGVVAAADAAAAVVNIPRRFKCWKAFPRRCFCVATTYSQFGAVTCVCGPAPHTKRYGVFCCEMLRTHSLYTAMDSAILLRTGISSLIPVRGCSSTAALLPCKVSKPVFTRARSH